ncbi:hypothetical protein O6H91_16G081500 [Diphasiastrum complanatum]|uniref:Uncharacterized protein n=2 Tax=Diphasiastrum complanatum TaxID=34168 RepID=A0ACC2BDK1_DIPCM|nr:hypothetical protein O6H91_16G058000 [Diphasiastrum complanatum]KAJ7528055.1 hypothetical protein O6H91_16G081500 [Diphasiastrum complanatum]
MMIPENKPLGLKKRRDKIKQKESPRLMTISEDSEGSRVKPVDANDESDCMKKTKPKIRSVPARLASVMRRLRDSYVSCLQQFDGVGDMNGLVGGGHTMVSPTTMISTGNRQARNAQWI